MPGFPNLDNLPVPYDALAELGLTHEQIVEAAQKRPRTLAFQADRHPGAWFDLDRARRALRALGAFTHTKGRWAGVRLRLGEGLDSWQVVWILAPIFGWVYYDAELDRVVRVIRRVWVEIPRKNGKSTISSAISGVLLLADQEPGAEVYNAAGSKQQAARVFDDAKQMLTTSRAARSRIEPLKDVVRVPRTASILRVLSSVAETAHGLNVSGAVVDEIHTLRRKAGLVDALETGVGARDQPLILFITTADEAEDGTPYDEKHSYTENLAAGVVEDPSFYGVVWGAEEGDDPFSEATWAKASPGFPKSPNRRYMETEAKKARNSPRELAVFKQLALNMRTASTTRWLDINAWDELTARPDRARLRGRRAWAGLDLSAVADFTAWAVWVESNRPGYELELIIDYWVPMDRIPELEEQLKVPLQHWVDEGHVHATEGDVVDYAAVKAKAIGDARHYDLQRISYDRMFAGQLVQEIDTATRGVTIAPVAQTFLGLSPASKEMERLIRGGTVLLPDDPVSRWMALWVEAKDDGLDNIRPVKPDRRKSMRRIDGIQAAVTGLDGWVRAGAQHRNRKITVHSRR